MAPQHLRLLQKPESPSPSDDALMSLAAMGDDAAFSTLVGRHQLAVQRLASLMLNDPALAKDVTQETFLRMWRHRSRYRPEGRARELLLTIARNLSRRALTRRRVSSFFGLAPALEPPAEQPQMDEALERTQLELLTQGALTRLPEHFRVSLMLRFVEGLSYAEVARVVGSNESTCRSRVHHGLKALRALLPSEVLP